MALHASIGQYLNGNSPLHRADARAKLVVALAYMASCLFVTDFASLALAAVPIAATATCARVPWRHLAGSLKPIALFLLITSLVNLFLVQTGDLVFALGPLSIHTDGITAAALYTSRFLFLVCAGGLLLACTTHVELADAATRLMSPLECIGVPVSQAALVLTIALRFVPTLQRDAATIVAAQTARGADLERKGALARARAYLPVAVPLFAAAVRHADTLGRAMDARCYTGGEGRTHLHAMHFDPRLDGMLGLCCIGYLIALAAVRILL